MWTVAVRPDKTADFERIMARLHDALAKSDKEESRRQAAGWRVIKMSQPMPDGNVAYTHVVHPVVAGADYSVMRVLYAAFPDERQALYDVYRGAFVKNVALATGSVAIDFAESAAAPALPTSSN